MYYSLKGCGLIYLIDNNSSALLRFCKEKKNSLRMRTRLIVSLDCQRGIIYYKLEFERQLNTTLISKPLFEGMTYYVLPTSGTNL